MATLIAIFGMPGHWEVLMLLAIGVLLFGKRLPEIGRSLGKGIVEFRKGIRGIEDEIDRASSEPAYQPQIADQQPSAPKFEPPSAPGVNNDSLDPESSEPTDAESAEPFEDVTARESDSFSDTSPPSFSD